MILLAHFTGNPNSRQAALCMQERGWLTELHTTLCWKQNNWVGRVIPGFLRRELERRTFPEVVQSHIRSHPMGEILRLSCRSRFLKPLSHQLDRFFSLNATLGKFDKTVARAVIGSKNIKAVYCYDGTGLRVMQAAKARRLKTIYELPTPYWRFNHQIVKEEAQLQPEWSMTLPGLQDSPDALHKKDLELQLADYVIVPSEFVAASLREAPRFNGQVHIVPYGAPNQENLNIPDFDSSKNDPLRVLFVGNLNQTKGLSYLATAAKSLKSIISLTVVGRRTNAAPCFALDEFLSQHRHINGVPHREILSIMSQYEVLVLPTLFEGLSLALLEAMSCGLTIITTPNSGIGGLITHGKEGFVVPPRNAGEIAENLQFLARNRERLIQMRRAALARSRELSWEAYRIKLGQILGDILS